MSNKRRHLQEMIARLDPIEIESTLEKEAVFNAVCGSFLLDGSNMFFITDSVTDGWIYFKDNIAIAAMYGELEGLNALQEILKIEFGVVSLTRNIESPKEHFTLSLAEFISFSKGEKTSPKPVLLALQHIDSLPRCKGFAVYKDGSLSIQHNIIAASLPLDYLKEVSGESQRGAYCRISQYDKVESYFAVEHQNSFWVFVFYRNAPKDNLNQLINETLEKVYAGV